MPQAQLKKRTTEEANLFTATSNFLRNNRSILVAIIAIALLTVIGLIIFSIVQTSAATDANRVLDKLEADYKEWQDLTSEDAKKAPTASTIKKEADEASKQWPSIYAGLRARFIKATVLEEEKSWKAAADTWSALHKAGPKTFLAPIALLRAGRAYEEGQDKEASLNSYRVFLEQFEKEKVLGLDQAKFNLARLYEGKKDYASAFRWYLDLATVDGQSDYGKLGRDRIIYIKAQNLLAADKIASLETEIGKEHANRSN